MKRTPISGVSFYHLQLGAPGLASQRALLLADRAGEDYRSVVDDPGAVRMLTEVERAECLTLLVDGKRLLDNEDRHNLRGELEVLVKALVDMEAVRSGQHLVVVLTKLDELADSPHEARAKRDFDQLVRQVRIHHADAFGSIREFQVAASPKKPTLARGTGVADLLTWWMSAQIAELAVEIQMPVAARAFGRLQSR
jgi:double-GTPase-like protein